mmetsp:Transcript_12138/g.51084  ORF Transcript_12138/g.51084 Transcript_12138/m.51084 type:complete len:203 (+) Transcript_12138:3060-3668(+)
MRVGSGAGVEPGWLWVATADLPGGDVHALRRESLERRERIESCPERHGLRREEIADLEVASNPAKPVGQRLITTSAHRGLDTRVHLARRDAAGGQIGAQLCRPIDAHPCGTSVRARSGRLEDSTCNPAVVRRARVPMVADALGIGPAAGVIVIACAVGGGRVAKEVLESRQGSALATTERMRGQCHMRGLRGGHCRLDEFWR